MGILYGLVAAMLYGTGDYLGGRASTRGDVRRVLLVSQSTAAIGGLLAVFVVSGAVSGAALGYGAAAGVASAVGLGLLYRALATGRAGVVAPLTAVVGAVVPVTWGLTRGERPTAVAIAGVIVAIAAAALIAREEDEDGGRRSGVTMALLAGLFLGSSFVCYAETPGESGMWPVLAARVVAVACAAAALLWTNWSSHTSSDDAYQDQFRTWAAIAVAAGVADVLATVSLVAGVRAELSVLVAAVTALAPGFTVMWAWVLLQERIGRVQAVGVVLALIGLVAIAAG